MARIPPFRSFRSLRRRPRLLALPVVLAAWVLAAPPRPAAADFPPVSDAERALKSAPGEPNAPAVALFKNAEFWMMDIARQEASSRLTVRTRIKILSDEGKAQGEVAVPHSSFMRLQGFRGRTVLPDGRVVPLPADAKFVRKMSRQERLFVTSVAFPAVEVGAILDYEYEMRFDSLFFLEPWYFSAEMPVMHSEIVYHIPSEVQVRVWARDPLKAGLKSEKSDQVRGGMTYRAWAEKLPALGSEPFGVPFSDLATQIMMVPIVYDDGLSHEKLMEGWDSTSALLLRQYDQARRHDGAAKKKARELTASAASPRDKVTALYHFVRDEIETEDLEGAFMAPDSSVDRVLSEKKGDYAEKALLLLVMLEAAKIEAQPVWAADRGRGIIDVELANPTWFQKVLVAVTLDGQRLFLDPSDRALALGQLAPGYEGMPAVVPHRKKPETLTLPETPFDQNRRQANVELALDGEGRLSGTGRMAFAGSHAWERIGWKGDSPTAEEAWKKWLEGEYEGFKISDVKVEEAADERRMEVRWAMAQREEEALGDEATLAPSRPWGPSSQPFPLPGGRRRSPVLFDYGDRDEVELKLRWPEGWRLENKPKDTKFEGPAGALEVAVAADEPARALTYRRRLDVKQKTFGSRELYEAVRSLFAETEKSDAQVLGLSKRGDR